MNREHQIDIRVRYQETDGQGRVHHANYFTYFEMGRVEMLRAAGYDYRKLEEEGTLLVVHKISAQYFQGALYDDVLTLTTRIIRITHARCEHEYEVLRGEELIAKGSSSLACIDRTGKVQRMPEWMVLDD